MELDKKGCCFIVVLVYGKFFSFFQLKVFVLAFVFCKERFCVYLGG